VSRTSGYDDSLRATKVTQALLNAPSNWEDGARRTEGTGCTVFDPRSPLAFPAAEGRWLIWRARTGADIERSMTAQLQPSQPSTVFNARKVLRLVIDTAVGEL
jgi:hypothetical protein